MTLENEYEYHGYSPNWDVFAVNTLLHSKKRFFSLIILILLIFSIPVAVYLSQRQQDVRQRAATGQADLIVTEFSLTDAGGNVKTTFAINEDIYVRVRIKNQGTAPGDSTDDITTSQIYSHKTSSVPFNTVSDVDVSLRNGEFGAGSHNLYESRINGEGQSKFTTQPYSQTSSRKYFWEKSSSGTYTARVLLNFDKHVTESNYDNNQAQLTYTVTNTGAAVLGASTTSAPSGFSTFPCVADENNVEPNLEACVTEGAVNGKTFARVRNKSTTATYKVGLASYKAYLPYPSPYPTCTPTSCPEQFNWIWTQTYYSSVTYDLEPGKTVYLAVDVPACAWQSDVFKGSVIPSYSLPDNWYSGKKTYLDGYYNTKLAVCQPVIPLPTPTPPQPTNTPTTPPGVTNTPTLPPDVTLTPSPSTCPIPPKVTNVRVICPYCKGGQP